MLAIAFGYAKFLVPSSRFQVPCFQIKIIDANRGINIIKNKCSRVKVYLFSVEKERERDQGWGLKERGLHPGVATGRGNRGWESNVGER